MENYNITSPIAGTVITKSVKLGDAIDSNTAMTTIYDLS